MKTKLQEDLKSAMKEKNSVKTQTLRNILTEIMKVEKNNGTEITEEKLNVVLKKLYSQREESSRIFKESNRIDLFEKENAELLVLKDYLPKEIPFNEQKEFVDKILKENNINPNEIGKIMKFIPQNYNRKLISEYLKTLN
jgi:uncharacterized protein YqeY